MEGFYTKNGEEMPFEEVMKRMGEWADQISADSPMGSRDIVAGSQLATQILEGIGGFYAVASIRRAMGSLLPEHSIAVVLGTLRNDLDYMDKKRVVESLSDVIARMKLES